MATRDHAAGVTARSNVRDGRSLVIEMLPYIIYVPVLKCRLGGLSCFVNMNTDVKIAIFAASYLYSNYIHPFIFIWINTPLTGSLAFVSVNNAVVVTHVSNLLPVIGFVLTFLWPGLYASRMYECMLVRIRTRLQGREEKGAVPPP